MDLDALIAAAKTGDADAFTELVRRYQAMAFGSAYAALGDVHLAEDAAQQAFLTAYLRLHTLEHPERFGGWLRGIVRFECSHLRRRRRVAQVPLDQAMELAATTPEPAQLAEDREALADLLAAINALPPAEREAAVLFYLQERSQREVAAFLNLPVSTVNNRLRTARNRLKQGGYFPMAKDALTPHRLPDDFAEKIGEIIRAQGAVIDARFPPDRLPAVLNALTITDDTTDFTLTAQVAQRLGDDAIRCIAVTAPDQTTVHVRPGMRVVDTARPITSPLDIAAIGRAISSIRRPVAESVLLETGIKVIDLLCPLPINGMVGLTGDMRSGKMVVVEEVIHRLAGTRASLSMLVFVETASEVEVVQQVDYRTSATIEAIYLPVADADPDFLQAATSELDAVLTLSRSLAEQGRYPAIDPLRSSSRFLDPAVVGEAQVQVAREVRQLFEQAARLTDDDRSPGDEIIRQRAARIQRYLTQPFFVAESFTRQPGRFVSRAETVADCRVLLDGSRDDIPDDALTMIGSLRDVTPIR